jgi:hypothetical protein
MHTVAALFVEARGCYSELHHVDLWDVARDARRYTGPHPVVAHPPCHLWVNFAALNFKRWGGDHNRPGNDGGCFASALASVRAHGGVLEHPASTNAWAAHGLPRPEKSGWSGGAGGWVCEVWQSAYGHRARKRTWLYASGARPPDLDWRRLPGTAQVGWFDRIKPTLSKREASATPAAFRDALLAVAMEAQAVRLSGRLLPGYDGAPCPTPCLERSAPSGEEASRLLRAGALPRQQLPLGSQPRPGT